METTNNSSDFTLVSILKFLWNWKKILLIVFAFSFIVSLVISLFITPQYESTLIVIPSQMGNVSRITLVPSQYNGDLMAYGKEDDCEHLIQILNSSTIVGRVCHHFNLMDHYEINPNLPYKNTRLYNKYTEQITIKRTENMAVQITVRDKDPEIARDIAVYIGQQYDTLCIDMKQERTEKAFEIVSKTRELLIADITMLQDSLTRLLKTGMFSYDNMSDRFAQQLAKEVASGNTTAINRLNKYTEVIANYGSCYVKLRHYLDYKTEQLKDLDMKYFEVMADAEQSVPYKYIVDEPYVPDQKVYPKRLLIVLISTVSALLMAIFVLLFIETGKNVIREIRKK